MGCIQSSDIRQKRRRKAPAKRNLLPQKITKELFIEIMKEIQNEREVQIQERKAKAFQECYNHFLDGNMQQFKQTVRLSNQNIEMLDQTIVRQVCDQFQVKQADLDNFYQLNQSDSLFWKSCLVTFQSFKSVPSLKELKLSEDQMEEIFSFAINAYIQCAKEIRWGRGEEAFQITVAFVACQIYQKFNIYDAQFERATIYYANKNQIKYQQFQSQLKKVCDQIVNENIAIERLN